MGSIFKNIRQYIVSLNSFINTNKIFFFCILFAFLVLIICCNEIFSLWAQSELGLRHSLDRIINLEKENEIIKKQMTNLTVSSEHNSIISPQYKGYVEILGLATTLASTTSILLHKLNMPFFIPTPTGIIICSLVSGAIYYIISGSKNNNISGKEPNDLLLKEQHTVSLPIEKPLENEQTLDWFTSILK